MTDSMSSQPTLASRHFDLTQRIILDGAIGLLEATGANELSVRAVAKHAGVSERTVFRYFATRDDLLDALAVEVSRRLETPPAPTSLSELLAFPEAIYPRFEAKKALTRAALHSELFDRIRLMNTDRRGKAVRALIDQLAPDRDEHERTLAAANIFYQLVATTWHHYRYHAGLSLDDSIECASMAIAQALAALGVRQVKRIRGPRDKSRPGPI